MSKYIIILCAQSFLTMRIEKLDIGPDADPMLGVLMWNTDTSEIRILVRKYRTFRSLPSTWLAYPP